MDVVKLLGEDFVAVGGAAYCCGIQHYQQGDSKAALSVAQTTVKNFEKFQPERVVVTVVQQGNRGNDLQQSFEWSVQQD